jgi:hypothetical protein
MGRTGDDRATALLAATALAVTAVLVVRRS